MPRGRPRNVEPRREIELSLPAPLCAQVDARLHDPYTQKARYGGWSSLVTSLLRDWLKQEQQAS